MKAVGKCGGKKRCVAHLVKRTDTFRKKVPRLLALRRSGIQVAKMTRTLGPPALTFGTEICGMADRHLQATRGVIARAASPLTSGRNVDLALLLLDGATGTVDPAFAVHALPIVSCARAIWSSWCPHGSLATSFRSAQARLRSARFP